MRKSNALGVSPCLLISRRVAGEQSDTATAAFIAEASAPRHPSGFGDPLDLL
jgi:hypothetical protein